MKKKKKTVWHFPLTIWYELIASPNRKEFSTSNNIILSASIHILVFNTL